MGLCMIGRALRPECNGSTAELSISTSREDGKTCASGLGAYQAYAAQLSVMPCGRPAHVKDLAPLEEQGSTEPSEPFFRLGLCAVVGHRNPSHVGL